MLRALCPESSHPNHLNRARPHQYPARHNTGSAQPCSLRSRQQPDSSPAWHTVSLQARDVNKTLSHKTKTVNLQDRDETETFHFFKPSRPTRDRDVEPSRPRRDETFNLQDRDVPKKRLETASRPRRKSATFQKRIKTRVSQFKNTNW